MTTPATIPATITVNGTEYRVERSERGNYLLTGKRGAVYGLFRHAERPELLFPVNLRRGTLPKTLADAWFTDADGALRVR
jgi:hypothetical protein